MLEGINYLHAKFQINILKNKNIIKLLELWQLWLKRKKRKEKKIANTRAVFTTLKNIWAFLKNTISDGIAWRLHYIEHKRSEKESFKPRVKCNESKKERKVIHLEESWIYFLCPECFFNCSEILYKCWCL